MVAMETLGLSSTPQKSDNIFQRLFWPTIQNQYDVDLLGQQGFWICVVIGAVSGLLLLFTGQWVSGLFTAFIFLAGACGVRQRSVAAASLIFTVYLLNVASTYIIAPVIAGNPLLRLFCLMLLLANVRATLISRRWLAAPKDEADTDLPERSTTTITDKFANQLPVEVWPKVRYAFYALAGLSIALIIVGTVFVASQKRPSLAPDNVQSITVQPSR